MSYYLGKRYKIMDYELDKEKEIVKVLNVLNAAKKLDGEVRVLPGEYPKDRSAISFTYVYNKSDPIALVDLMRAVKKVNGTTCTIEKEVLDFEAAFFIDKDDIDAWDEIINNTEESEEK